MKQRIDLDRKYHSRTAHSVSGKFAALAQKSVMAMLVLGASFTLSMPSMAATWPTGTVTLVVPFTPGGSNDIIARNLAGKLQTITGKTFIVENKPGAGSVVGSAYVANAAADGNTFLFVSSSLVTASATRKTPFDIRKDFAPVTAVARAPMTIAVRENFPDKTLSGLLKYAKDNPNQVTYGTAGRGSINELATELLASGAGVKLRMVPYKGMGPAQLDLISGRLDMLTVSEASINGSPADSLPKLAWTGEERNTAYPDVPTVKEATDLDYSVYIYWRVLGPKGTSPDVLNAFGDAVSQVAKDEEFQKVLANMSTEPYVSTPEQTEQELLTEVDMWEKTAKEAGIDLN